MTNSWAKKDIEEIFIQLNERGLPFNKYAFSALGDGMVLLGSGASAYVYEATSKQNKKEKFALKVIGFENKLVSSVDFNNYVNIQKDTYWDTDSILKIYEAIELRLWIEGDNRVIRAEEVTADNVGRENGNCLHLQFILMEKLFPVLRSVRLKRELYPPRLQNFDEREIVKLAYDIGSALNEVHRNNLIHRDIKLENIFYDEKEKIYKLGDFGISKETDYGLASTAVFTKGYGAPEVVGALDDKYDKTADIYSLGIMVYLLLNELKFPGSDRYQSTVHQYLKGFVPPRPQRGSDELVSIVLKMISFNPEDRYQSMQEVLNELLRTSYGYRHMVQNAHKNETVFLGVIFLAVGLLLFKTTFFTNLKLEMTPWSNLLCGILIARGLLEYYKKNTLIVSLCAVALEVYICFTSGFAWWSLLPIAVTIILNYVVAIAVGVTLIINVLFYICNFLKISAEQTADFRWISVFLLLMSFFLLIRRSVLGVFYHTTPDSNKGKDTYWSMVFIICMMIFVLSVTITPFSSAGSFNAWVDAFHFSPPKQYLNGKLYYVGIAGMVFCIFWGIRRKLLVLTERLRHYISDK